MKPVVITRQADSNLRDIFRFIESRDSALAAHRWTSKLLKAAMGIAKYPDLGVLMPDEFGKNILRIRLKKYYIYYTTTPKQIIILAFIHGSRQQHIAMQGKRA